MCSDPRGADDSPELIFSTPKPGSEDAHQAVAKRRKRIIQPEPIGHLRATLALASCLGSLAFTLLAGINDWRAFAAVATPGLICCFVLGVFVLAGVVLIVYAGVMGIRVPWYFPAAVIAGGVTICVFTLPIALKIATKNHAEVTASIEGTTIDLRNKIIRDRSFTGEDLRRSNFSGATLYHVDLSGTDLSESDLRNARFHDVDLSGARLCGADLRDADLRGAHGLNAIADWSYAFYNRHTELPEPIEGLLHLRPGPIPDTGRDLLYMCERDVTRRIDA